MVYFLLFGGIDVGRDEKRCREVWKWKLELLNCVLNGLFFWRLGGGES